MLKKRNIFILISVLLVVIQFIHPAKNNGEIMGNNHISKAIEVSSEVETILAVSCYDCHSNKTNYPWYSNLQTVNWWLTSHVKDGKRHLNFSEFATYSAKKQNHKMEEMVEMIEKNEMPLSSYTLIHTRSKLTSEQKQLLIDWAKKNYVPESDSH
jgi:Haem-binding domain